MEGSKAARDLRDHLMWTYLFRQATLYPSKETMALHIQNILRHTKSMILLPGSFSCWSHLWPKIDSTSYLHFLLLIFKPICLHLPFRDLWKHSSPVKIRQNQKHLLKISLFGSLKVIFQMIIIFCFFLHYLFPLNYRFQTI